MTETLDKVIDMNKGIFILVFTLAACVALTGCGGSNKSGSASTAVNSQASAATIHAMTQYKDVTQGGKPFVPPAGVDPAKSSSSK